MEQIFFWSLAAGLLTAATAVVVLRNPVSNAVCLVVGLVFQAALFITLEANFLAAVQVIVYAGAVMVLFLFVIMLLDVKEEARRPLVWSKVFGVAAGAVVAVLGIPRLVASFPASQKTLVWGEGKTASDAQSLGTLLFTSYAPLFLSTGVLLLVATVGVVVLCRRDPGT
ncbi:MAG: NADH-quinone oxidoreductase subunit J [Verrucomicrobia bacterium]|jgi:NADH-quinone oxidoreductase subunit J|nr:NADH-quinone oxidoreductase subunit J [Verrucomicrobiota bacterium]